MPKPESRAATAALVVAIVLVSALTAFGVNKEVPISPVTGTVTMFENKKPLPKAFVTFTPDYSSEDYKYRDYTVRTDENGNFKFRRLPVGNYTVSVRGTAHDVEKRMVAVVEGSANKLNFEAVPRDPWINFALNNPVFLPDEPIQVKSSGFLVDRSIKLKIWRIEPERIRDSRNLNDVLTSVTRNRNPQDPAKVADGPVVHESEQKPDTIDLEGAYTSNVKLPQLPRGVYRALASTKGAQSYFWFTVTDLGIVTKTGDTKATTWAVDLRTGKPRARVSIDVVSNQGVRHAGTTNADGLLTTDVPRGKDQNTRQTMIMASEGENRAYTWWNRYDEHEDNVAWTVTDKPVYRSGDTVNFKSFIRRPFAVGYGPSTLHEVEVELRGPDGESVGTMRKQVSGDGKVDGSFKIEDESPSGSYEIVLTSGEWTDSHYFPVAQYRKPEYNIQVKADTKQAYYGDNVPVTIQVNTYTGEPAVNAKVTAQVYRKQLYWEGEDDYYDSSTDYSEYVKSEDLSTDEQGRTVILVDTKHEAKRNRNSWGPSYDAEQYQVQVEVTGTGDRYYNGSGHFNAYPGDLRLTAETTDYSASPGQPFRIQVFATGRDNDKPVPGQVSVKMTRTSWERTDREAEDGEPSREKKSIYPVTTTRLDATGHGVAEVVPDKPGDYDVVLTMDDSKGRKVEAHATFWVPGEQSSDRKESYLGVELTKRVYEVSDVAKAIVRSDKPGVPVLVTVETDDVAWSKILPMDSDTAVVDLPALRSTPSGATVSVCRVTNRDMQTAEAEIKIGKRGKRLKVHVTSDRKKAKPGEDVAYQIQTTDEQGTPVSADLAFSVVDESVYAIREDGNDPLGVFYPEHSSTVQTTWSFPSIYFDGGDKSPAEIKVRRDFKDTAFWTADLHTGPDGTASVHVRLPDNLTEWRATVCAVTSDAAVGKGRSAVIATQDLMARLSLPPFMVQTDQQQVSATLTNTTDKALDVQVDLDLHGAKTSGQINQRQTVPANSAKVLSWDVVAGDPGNATVKLTASSRQGPADAIEMNVPVHTNGRAEYWHAGGILNGAGEGKTSEQTLMVPTESTTGALEVRLSPGLAGTMLSQVDELIDYPYGCVEQTLSKMVPAVLTHRTLLRAGYADPELDKKVDEVLRRGFARLRDMRPYGGGWGWFHNDPPNPFVTAVAIEGLESMRAEGVKMPGDWAKADIEWGYKFLETPPRDPWDAQERLALVAALARVAPRPPLLRAMADIFATGLDLGQTTMSKESTAWTALIYQRLSQSPNPAVVAAVRASLPFWTKRVESMTPRSAAEGDDYGSETIAMALVEIEPDSDLTRDAMYRLAVPPVRRNLANTWLLHRSVKAVAAYLAKHPERLGEIQAEVMVNGTTVDSRKLAGANLVRVPLSGLRKGENQISVKVAGGTATYAMDYKGMVYEPNSTPLALASGFSLERTYHKMEVATIDGQKRLVPAKDPSTEFKSGEIFRVRLKIRTTKTLRYVAIEDFLPSNTRTVELDRSLDGSNNWGYWWCATDFRDDRTVYFSRELDPGEHVLEYAVRAESPGTCNAPPASAYPMYDPGMVVRSGALKAKVGAK